MGYAVSIEPQRWLLEQLVDSGTNISVVMERGADPETFEPTMAQRRSADDAAAYFITGTLPFEKTITEGTSTRIVDTSEGIEPVYGTHSHGDHDHHGIADPHMWTSVSGARVMAANMTETLCAIDTAHADEYRARLSTLDGRLDSIDAAIRARLSEAPHSTFAIWHPSLSYYARDYGLRQLALGSEGKEMSARQLREAIDTARADSVGVFFIQKEYDVRQAQPLNDGIGARLVVIDPLDYNWDNQMTLIADELAKP